MLTVLGYPSTELLTTRAAIVAEGALGTLTDAQNAVVDDLIASASSTLVGHCGRAFARALVLERVPGFDGLLLQVAARLPIAVIDTILYRNSDAFTDYVIDDRDAGLIYRENGWYGTQNFGRFLAPAPDPSQERPDWYVTYAGGWLLPGDNVTAKTTIAATVTSGVYKFTDSGNNFPVLLRAGDRVTVSGFASPATANNKTYTVTGTPTASEVQVVEAVTAKAAGDTVSIVCANLPKAIQDAATLTVLDMYRNAARNAQVTSKGVSKLSIAYGSGRADGGDSDMIPPRALGMVRPYRIVVGA